MLNKKEIEKFNKLVDRSDTRISIIFNALGDATRCRIFRLLLKKEASTLGVGDIAQILHISASAVSQHLKILQITGLVQREKKGQRAYFKPSKEDPLVEIITKAIK